MQKVQIVKKNICFPNRLPSSQIQIFKKFQKTYMGKSVKKKQRLVKKGLALSDRGNGRTPLDRGQVGRANQNLKSQVKGLLKFPNKKELKTNYLHGEKELHKPVRSMVPKTIYRLKGIRQLSLPPKALLVHTNAPILQV